MKSLDRLTLIIVIAILGFDITLWHQILAHHTQAGFYALDVGQGDSTLLTFQNGVKILTDAGPDHKVVQSLEKIMSDRDRYIDLAVISHPQLDHFNGFNDLVDRYSFGAFIINGRDSDDHRLGNEWDALKHKLKEKNIPVIILGAGDSIKNGANSIQILSPNEDFIQSGELNDTALVEFVTTPSWRALLTGDAGTNIEDFLVQRGLPQVDILKIGHHGSKYSSGLEFLRTLRPAVATISDGARNRYGHPAPEALERLEAAGVQVFRTDEHGTISIFPTGAKLRLQMEK